MEEVRRPVDGELCGHVELRDGSWFALVVFGAVLGRHSTRENAVAQVLSEGLASLAERWTLRRGDGSSDEVVCIQEANAQTVTLALGYYSMPGVPTLTITASEVGRGRGRVEHAPIVANRAAETANHRPGGRGRAMARWTARYVAVRSGVLTH